MKTHLAKSGRKSIRVPEGLLGYSVVQLSGFYAAQVMEPAESASYLLIIRLTFALRRFANAPFYSQIPKFNRLYVKKDLGALRSLAIKRMSVSMNLFLVGSLIMVFILPPALAVFSGEAVVNSKLWVYLSIAGALERYGAMSLQLYTLTNDVRWHVANGVSGVIMLALFHPLYLTVGTVGLVVSMLLAYGIFYMPYSVALTRKLFKISIPIPFCRSRPIKYRVYPARVRWAMIKFGDFLLLALSIAVIGCLLFAHRRLRITDLDPITLFLWGWLGVFTLLTVNLITYPNILSIKTFLILNTFICAVFFGGLVAGLKRPQRQAASADTDRSILKLIVIFEVGFFVYGAASIINILSTVQLIFSDLGSLRVNHWLLSSQTGEVDVADVFQSIGRTTGILLLAIPTSSLGVIHKRPQLVKLVVWSFLCLEQLSVGGRGVIFYGSVIWAYSEWIRIQHNHGSQARDLQRIFSGRKRLLGYMGVTAALYLLLVVFPSARNSDYVDNYDKYLWLFKHDNHISLWVRSASADLPFLPGLAFSTSYFSLPVVKFTDAIDVYEIENWYYGGGYNFALVSKILQPITGGNNFYRARDQIAENISRQGYSTLNPWGTFARDFIIDFGLFGGIIFAFAFGYGLQRVYIYAVVQGGVLTGVFGAFSGLCAALAIFTSPLNITFWRTHSLRFYY